MVWFLLSLIPIITFILTISVKFNFSKDTDTKLYIHFFGKEINLLPTKRKSSERKEKKNNLTFSERINPIAKRLKHIEIYVNKISVPISDKEFSVSSFLFPYELNAFIFSIITFVQSAVKKFEASNDAFHAGTSNSKFCLDINIKIKLFYVLLILVEYLLLSKKSKRKRRKVYVGQ